MQPTNYTIKIQIQNKAIGNWLDPLSVMQVSSNIGLSFETVGLDVRLFCTDSVQSDSQLLGLTNPRSAGIQTSQSVKTWEIFSISPASDF